LRPPASLTHGDLWTDNVVDERWLVHPAVTYVDRELEFACLDMADLPAEFHTPTAPRGRPPPATRGGAWRCSCTSCWSTCGTSATGTSRIEAVFDGFGW
jgi:hypothetical protein